MATLTRRTPDQYITLQPTEYQNGTQNVAQSRFAFTNPVMAQDVAYIANFPLSQVPQPAAMGTQEWYDNAVATAYSSAAGFMAVYANPQVTALAQKWDTGGLPSTTYYGNTDTPINVTIDWDLTNRQAMTGTPQWARKILNDQVGNIPGSLADSFQQAFPTVQSKLDYFTGGNDFSATGQGTDAIFGTSYQAGVHVTTASSGREDTPRADGQWFDTLKENVSGYGIPVTRAGERLIDTDYDTAWEGTGAFVSPRYELAPVMNVSKSQVYTQDWDNIQSTYNTMVYSGPSAVSTPVTLGGWNKGIDTYRAEIAAYNAPLSYSSPKTYSSGNSWYW